MQEPQPRSRAGGGPALTTARPKEPPSTRVQFEDNKLLPALFGGHDENLAQIERLLDVTLRYRGNRLEIAGDADDRAVAHAAIMALYRRLGDGSEINQGEVRAAVSLAAAGDHAGGVVIRTRRRTVTPRTPTQRAYMSALAAHELVFGLGPAGTGKTYIAVAHAVSLLLQGTVERIVLSRPAVEAGERLGFLPGDLQDKIDPYLRPLYDALHDMLPGTQVANRLANGEIEVAPLAFMRGRTLSHACIILDEAQNTSSMQMKMFLTRLGEGSRMVVTGDLSQIDLPAGTKSGLIDAVGLLAGVKGVAQVRFDHTDVVRHDMVQRIVSAYDARAQAAGKPSPNNGGGTNPKT